MSIDTLQYDNIIIYKFDGYTNYKYRISFEFQ